jgi:phosphatidylglycerophosphate synthase
MMRRQIGNKLDIRREIGKRFTSPIVPILSKAGFTPNSLTWIGLAINLAAAVVVGFNYLLIGGILVLVSALFDLFDGALARYTQKTTNFGALLDSTFDRISEGALLFGLMVVFVQKADLVAVSLIFAAMIFSFIISYIRARAEGLGIDCKVGFFTRPERVAVIVIGLIFNIILFYALIVLALFSFATVVQRLVFVYQKTRVK